ncbi:hypothetical protein EBU71_05115 [bacterium]|nr:hypothetical protein [Candidatus Elulimicrobium humile]
MREVTIIQKNKSPESYVFSKTEFFKFLDDKNIIKAEELAKQVVKEVWKLASGEKFSVMNYTFTSEKI